jgi:hypothetical protein
MFAEIIGGMKQLITVILNAFEANSPPSALLMQSIV